MRIEVGDRIKYVGMLKKFQGLRGVVVEVIDSDLGIVFDDAISFNGRNDKKWYVYYTEVVKCLEPIIFLPKGKVNNG